MRAQLDVLTGARAGAVLFFGGEAVTVGRHPDSDIQFHPQRDLAVSIHHALLFCRSGLWFVRDLASRNGTFVNGVRLGGDRPLVPGDRILFGHGGPEVEFRYAPIVSPGAEQAVADRRPGAVPLPAPSEAMSRADVPSQTFTAERLRVQLIRKTHTLRWVALGLSVVLVGVALALFAMARHQEAGREDERSRVEDRLNRLLEAPDPGTPAPPSTPVVPGEAGAPSDAGAAAGQAREGLQVGAAPEPGPPGGVVGGAGNVPPADPLATAARAMARLEAGTTMDFGAVEALNRRAVVRLYVESAEGVVVTGTAFAVRGNGTLVTSAHLVVGEGGVQPGRIGAQFADSDQVWPARFLLASPGADLALVKVDNIVGDVPIVPALNPSPDTLAPGTPLALLGFPMGGDAPEVGAEGRPVVRPLLSAGVLEHFSTAEMVIQGYGAVGASGSPVLDASGALVAVVFGGRGDGDDHRLLAVPAPAVGRLLTAVPDIDPPR